MCVRNYLICILDISRSREEGPVSPCLQMSPKSASILTGTDFLDFRVLFQRVRKSNDQMHVSYAIPFMLLSQSNLCIPGDKHCGVLRVTNGKMSERCRERRQRDDWAGDRHIALIQMWRLCNSLIDVLS